MYLPALFNETDEAVVRRIIAENPLATLVTKNAGDGSVNANHIPLHLTKGGSLAAAAPQRATLLGHVAAANSIVADLRADARLLVIFLGIQSYISPSLYASKKIDGKVVPTWNYEAIHLQCKVRLIEDEHGLMDILKTLTHEHEHTKAEPWAVDDAPQDYTRRLMGAIVGFELSIESWQAKRKLSQNQTPQNRQSVIEGLGKVSHMDQASYASHLAMAAAVAAAKR